MRFDIPRVERYGQGSSRSLYEDTDAREDLHEDRG